MELELELKFKLKREVELELDLELTLGLDVALELKTLGLSSYRKSGVRSTLLLSPMNFKAEVPIVFTESKIKSPM